MVDNEHKPSASPANLKWILAGLGGLVILFLVFFLTIREEAIPPIDTETTFKAHFEIPVWKADKTKGEPLWQAAVTWYQEKNYGAAVNALSSCLEDEGFTQTEEAIFYRGVCWLALGKDLVMTTIKKPLELAISDLEKVAESNPYHEDARWYLALTYLRSEQLREAKKELKSIARSDSRRKADARKLLEIF